MNEHIDKALVRNRFARSFRTHVYAAIIQPGMAKYLLELLRGKTGRREFANVLELGCGISTMATEFVRKMSAETWVANDIVPCSKDFEDAVRDLPLKEYSFLNGDMEEINLPGNQDLIISNAALQWMKQKEKFISMLVKKLAPGGILAFSTFGPENLCEMRELTGLSLEYLPSSAYPPLLDAYGEVLCVEELKSVIKFDSPIEVLRHLRDTGTNSLDKQAWTKGTLKQFSDLYVAKFAKGEQVGLTYHPMYVIFQKY